MNLIGTPFRESESNQILIACKEVLYEVCIHFQFEPMNGDTPQLYMRGTFPVFTLMLLIGKALCCSDVNASSLNLVNIRSVCQKYPIPAAFIHLKNFGVNST